MSEREFTCVVCPNGCPITVEADDGENPVVARVRGNGCEKGEVWARLEVEDPRRTIASSVPVREGDEPLASVRTTRPVPLRAIPAVMAEIAKAVLDAPASIGDLVLSRPAGVDTEVVVTRDVGTGRSPASGMMRRGAGKTG